MEEPFAAKRGQPSDAFLSHLLGGRTDISAPESTRNFKCDFLSQINKRRDSRPLSRSAALSEGLISFPA